MKYRTHRYEELMEEVSGCRKCPMMNFDKYFLNIHNGNLKADLFFVGEGPSLGKDWNARPTPMANSQSGDNFDKYLEYAGLSRYDVFTTNAVIHTPITKSGGSMSPTMEQVRNCSGHLTQLIDLVQPILVIAIGKKALGALSLIQPHYISDMFGIVGRVQTWYGRHLTGLVHPSTQTHGVRSPEDQITDYKFIANIAKTLKKMEKIK